MDPQALPTFRLDGKVAVVTGASAGLGRSFALTLARAGADVALAARRDEELGAARADIETIGRRSIAVPVDVADVAGCRTVVQQTVRRLGRVDVLVSAAGISDARPALRQDPEEFERVVAVNLNGTYWMAQACAAEMGPGSSIINVSSVLGLTWGPVPSAGYAASKAGVIGLTRDLAAQWASRRQIRVNTLAPGFFKTEMTEPLLANDGLGSQVRARIPMGRLGDPEELDGALLFLASDASRYVTGATLTVDGGWTMA
ncbi:MAG: glucose 1-dehydrogenase [Actinobacteria bacterium]|nr:glucose 1-dehydrogenase [Actinomycetota bacterium]